MLILFRYTQFSSRRLFSIVRIVCNFPLLQKQSTSKCEDSRSVKKAFFSKNELKSQKISPTNAVLHQKVLSCPLYTSQYKSVGNGKMTISCTILQWPRQPLHQNPSMKHSHTKQRVASVEVHQNVVWIEYHLQLNLSFRRYQYQGYLRIPQM